MDFTFSAYINGNRFGGTFSDPRCDLDAHYGKDFVKRLFGYAGVAAFAVALGNCYRLYSLRA